MCTAWSCLDDVFLSPIHQCWQLQTIELFTVKDKIEQIKLLKPLFCITSRKYIDPVYIKNYIGCF
uniref:Uncharacterized protein n=1 Tax=Lepeophtheirus salmonis TaxID=72036 RepID=A0A0K2U0V8_LEPSM